MEAPADAPAEKPSNVEEIQGDAAKVTGDRYPREKLFK
jgi:hypothetical protein